MGTRACGNSGRAAREGFWQQEDPSVPPAGTTGWESWDVEGAEPGLDLSQGWEQGAGVGVRGGCPPLVLHTCAGPDLTPCPFFFCPLPVSLPFQKVMLPTGAAFRWFQ